MSGHSKWATIKHKKGAIDKARGKLFAKLARQLEVAARTGGMDVDTNAALRTMVQKAKAGQMTNDAIDRAMEAMAACEKPQSQEAVAALVKAEKAFDGACLAAENAAAEASPPARRTERPAVEAPDDAVVAGLAR